MQHCWPYNHQCANSHCTQAQVNYTHTNTHGFTMYETKIFPKNIYISKFSCLSVLMYTLAHICLALHQVKEFCECLWFGPVCVLSSAHSTDSWANAGALAFVTHTQPMSETKWNGTCGLDCESQPPLRRCEGCLLLSLCIVYSVLYWSGVKGKVVCNEQKWVFLFFFGVGGC